jgi:hypothetical protein
VFKSHPWHFFASAKKAPLFVTRQKAGGTFCKCLAMPSRSGAQHALKKLQTTFSAIVNYQIYNTNKKQTQNNVYL